jgi:hypothetical protein
MFTFDDSPVLYFALGNLLFIIAGGISVYSFINETIFRDKKVVIATLSFFFLLLLMLMLPVIVYNHAFNPDEDMLIVGAMTLAEEYYYWDSVDGGSSGPFNFYIITVFCELLKQPYDYISTRIIGTALLIGSFIFYFLALQKMFSTTVALLSIFPLVVYFAFSRKPDFLHFSSERLPIFLMGIMIYLLAIIDKQLIVNKITAFLFGLIVGITIFTKVQVIPIAFALSLLVLWLIVRKTKKLFSLQILWLSIGTIIVPLILCLIALKLNFIDKIWIYYFYNHLQYGENNNIVEGFFNSLFDEVNIFLRVIVVLSIALLTYHLIIKKQYKPSSKAIFMVVFLGSTLLVIYKTGFVFHHYLLLLAFPAVFLYAFFLNDLFKIPSKRSITIVLIIITTGLLSSNLAYPFTNNFVTAGNTQRSFSISPTGSEILKYLRPNEKLVIWGDKGRLYLETNRKQGIRWSNSHWGMYNARIQKNYQDEYVRTFKQGNFPVFIDAHGTRGTFMTRDKCGFETLPTLKEIIDEEYKFVGEFDENRIFVRKDRIGKQVK